MGKLFIEAIKDHNMTYGNWGKLLHVDLSNGELSDYDIPEEYLKHYLGGKGLGARILWDLLPEDGSTDPFSPDNPLLFLVGPLVGHNVMGSARYVVMTKSPLAKYITEAYGGGFFPYSLKANGYDGIIFEGESKKPVYLEMLDGEIQLKDASEYWGKGVFEVHDTLVESYDEKIRTAIIGPAGENKVRFSAVINDRDRAAARGGPGAVMGSKKVKAIVAYGNKQAPLHDEEKFKEANSTFRDGLVNDIKIRKTFGVYGTSGGVPYLHSKGILPTKNFSRGQFEGHDKISGQYMEESGLLVGRDTCSACSTFCKRKIEGEFNGNSLTQNGSSLEYETLAAFGSMVLNDDIKLSGFANQLCNDYGLDTISTGGTIAFSMEASEKGLLDDLGTDLDWGNKDHIETAIRKLATREEWGDDLAEGVMRLAEKIGGQSFAMHVKGLEVAYHEPRGKVGLGLSYAVSPRGASHMEGFHDTSFQRENANPRLGATEAMSRFEPEGKAPLVVNFENARSFTNNLIMCAFDVAMTGKNQNLDYLCEITSAATGYDIDLDKMLEIGDRTYNMLRMVAVREGCSAEDDDLPDRFKHEALHYEDDVESAITPEKLDLMLSEYYENRGWTTEGKVAKETIDRLVLPQ